MSASTAKSSSKAVRHWAQMGESTLWFGIVLLFWVHRLLGRWPFRLCLYPVVLGHWLLRRDVRRASREYLQRLQLATGALGHVPGWRDSLRHVALFAETMLDKLLAVSGRYRFEGVTIEGADAIHTAVAAGRGGLIVTAHIGCLELCRVLSEQRSAVRLNLLVHTRHALKFNELLRRLNPSHELQMIEVTQITPATAMLLAEKVDAGEYVVIAGDRVPVFASQTVQAEFLGVPAPFPVGPYVLASLLKCPLWMLGCIHQGSSYLISFQQLAECVQLPRKSRQLALAGYAATYAQSLTALLRRSPYDWFNFFPFWDQTHVQAHP